LTVKSTRASVPSASTPAITAAGVTDGRSNREVIRTEPPTEV
jgi:hypothetical protein